MIKFYIELLYDSGSYGWTPLGGGKGSRMNQNGFEPRNTPGYSYGQPNTYPQSGYPGDGMAQPQGVMQNPTGGYQASAPAFQQPQNTGYVQGTPAFGYPPVQNGNGYHSVQQAAVPPTPAATGYTTIQQISATGGFNPGSQASVAGAYNPNPPMAAAGGYNPASQAPMNAGYSPIPPAAAGTGYIQQPAPAAPTGSFIPRTPYSPGYTTPGYQPTYQKPAANGYPQGYSAYSQMGRTVPSPVTQQPN